MNFITRLFYLILVLITSETWSATFYVAPTGKDTNSGSISAPWATPAKAFRATLAAGSIVYFRGGSYTFRGDGLTVKSSGSSTSPITFASYPGETAVLVYDRQTPLTDATLQSLLYIGASNIVIDRLHFRQTETSRSYTIRIAQTDTGISVWGTNNKIRNCNIDNTSGLGIYVRGRGALVENCKIINHRSHTFYVAGADGIFRNNYMDCSRGYWNQRCIQIQYSSSVGNKIYNNLVLNGQAGGVVFSGPVTNNLVYNNIFINNGIKLDTGNGTYGVVLDFHNETGSAPGLGNKFYNNTILGKKPNSSLIASNPHGLKVEVFNNIFRTAQAATVGGYSGMKIQNNVFYNISTSSPSGNITTDPKLANPSGTTAASAKIISGSSAYDRGLDSGLRVDYFGNVRPRGVRLDIGAHEL